jgi:hypothetical protein
MWRTELCIVQFQEQVRCPIGVTLDNRSIREVIDREEVQEMFKLKNIWKCVLKEWETTVNSRRSSNIWRSGMRLRRSWNRRSF